MTGLAACSTRGGRGVDPAQVERFGAGRPSHARGTGNEKIWDARLLCQRKVFSALVTGPRQSTLCRERWRGTSVKNRTIAVLVPSTRLLGHGVLKKTHLLGRCGLCICFSAFGMAARCGMSQKPVISGDKCVIRTTAGFAQRRTSVDLIKVVHLKKIPYSWRTVLVLQTTAVPKMP